MQALTRCCIKLEKECANTIFKQPLTQLPGEPHFWMTVTDECRLHNPEREQSTRCSCSGLCNRHSSVTVIQMCGSPGNCMSGCLKMVFAHSFSSLMQHLVSACIGSCVAALTNMIV